MVYSREGLSALGKPASNYDYLQCSLQACLHPVLLPRGPLACYWIRAETDDAQVQLHALASLMMVATHDPRHAAVVARTGAIPALLALLQRCALRQAAAGKASHGQAFVDGEQSVGASVEGDEDADAEDFCASVLASLCRYDAIQVGGAGTDAGRHGQGGVSLLLVLVARYSCRLVAPS